MRSLRASASSCSSAVRLSSTTWRIAARAALSSLISAIFRTVRRFTTASAMRSATAAWRDIPAYPTRGRRGVSRNGPLERGENHGDARADDRRALDVNRAAVGLDRRQRRLACDLDRMRCGPLTEEIDGRRDRRLHREGNAAQRRCEAALDPREVEQVADDPAEALGLATHDPGESTHLLRWQAPQRQELAEALKRRQRSA